MAIASIVRPVESVVLGVVIAAVIVAVLCAAFDGLRSSRLRRRAPEAGESLTSRDV